MFMCFKILAVWQPHLFTTIIRQFMQCLGYIRKSQSHKTCCLGQKYMTFLFYFFHQLLLHCSFSRVLLYICYYHKYRPTIYPCFTSEMNCLPQNPVCESLSPSHTPLPLGHTLSGEVLWATAQAQLNGNEMRKIKKILDSS